MKKEGAEGYEEGKTREVPVEKGGIANEWVFDMIDGLILYGVMRIKNYVVIAVGCLLVACS
ncbi:MAG: hypothetical protein SOY65_09945 [Marinifilaceae bacterium]|nr:hypothetical protein [Marinifilaceae bacterium]